MRLCGATSYVHKGKPLPGRKTFDPACYAFHRHLRSPHVSNSASATPIPHWAGIPRLVSLVSPSRNSSSARWGRILSPRNHRGIRFSPSAVFTNVLVWGRVGGRVRQTLPLSALAHSALLVLFISSTIWFVGRFRSSEGASRFSDEFAWGLL